ncbi:uncharacterized protein [Littorina saxatilis]|uniref:uncharacterized protein n=1 Tax=Littorina saxatilis TaxID=31220 RepID=UPI0038B50CE4
MECLWPGVLCVCVLHLLCLTSWTTGSDTNSNGPMWIASFEGVDHLKHVGCKTDLDNHGFSLLQLLNSNSSVLVAWVKGDRQRDDQCEVHGSNFAQCVVDEGERTVTVEAVVVVTGLDEGDTELFLCSAMFVTGLGVTYDHHNISLTYHVPTTVTPSSSTITEDPTPRTEQSVAQSQDALFPASVVIAILTLLVMLVTLTCVLAVFYLRGRRRKQKSRDCDAMSARSGVSDRSFYTVAPLGGRGFVHGNGTAKSVRPWSGYTPPPTTTAPDVPGTHRVVMQYQRPTDSLPNTGTFSDRGYTSWSSGHYQEPWTKPVTDQEALTRKTGLTSHSREAFKVDFDSASFTTPSPSPFPATSTQDTGFVLQEVVV